MFGDRDPLAGELQSELRSCFGKMKEGFPAAGEKERQKEKEKKSCWGWMGGHLDNGENKTLLTQKVMLYVQLPLSPSLSSSLSLSPNLARTHTLSLLHIFFIVGRFVTERLLRMGFLRDLPRARARKSKSRLARARAFNDDDNGGGGGGSVPLRKAWHQAEVFHPRPIFWSRS